MPDSEEHAYVHGHFLNDSGQSPANCAFSYGSSPGDWKGVSLAPGESLELPVTFGHDKPAAVGSYAIEAILVSLNLRSPKGTLEVVADSGDAPRMTFSAAQNAERLLQEDYGHAIESSWARIPQARSSIRHEPDYARTDKRVGMTVKADTGVELRSLITPDARLEISLVEVPIPVPQPNEVLIRVEAAPINPSDLGLLLANTDMSSATVTGDADHPVVTAALTPAAMRALAGRVGASLPVGNEGAGTVIAAGSEAVGQALVGRVVAVSGGGMYAQYRCVDAAQCLVLPEGTPARAGASSFVNPLTALGMVETMRREGHTALVHTAAASNLGQMLNRLCIEDGVPLVNIVRKPEQEEMLRANGASHVCNSASSTFSGDLIEALQATSATLAFDAIGGGALASQILTAMEAVSTATGGAYSRYGSTTNKQVYVYGGLDPSPTVLKRNFGMAWGVGGWLLPPFLARIGPAAFQVMRERVAAELTTTFVSSYTKAVSLAEALQPQAFLAYARQATGEKFLITPNAD